MSSPTEPPAEKPMSQLFRNLRFLLLPNNRAGVTQIRSKVARNHSAAINSRFTPEGKQWATTHVLVDKKVLLQPSHVWKKLLEAGFPEQEKAQLLLSQKIPVLSQTWLSDSVEAKKLQPYDEYLIDLKDASISSTTTPSPRKRTASSPLQGEPPSKTQLLEDYFDHEIVKDNPNWKAINLLSQMAHEREIEGSVFKVKAYKRAVDTLEKTREHVTTYQQAMKLPGVGSAIAKKIVEITRTDDLQLLRQLQESDQLKLLKLFKGIYGVGDAIARAWIHQGLKTLDDVKARDDLSTNQRLGLDFYDEWNEKIDREECTIHNEYVTKIFHEVDPQVEVTIGGSYRRGSKTCGDIDFIITKKDAEINELRELLEKFMTKIKSTGYWTCALNNTITTRWLGGCSLLEDWNERATGETNVRGKCRRVDFLLVPWKEIGAALIYFTGNNEFNKMARVRAIKRGMSLSGQGLYKVQKGEDGTIIKQELVESFSERKIFEILGMHWVEPTSRNIGDDMIGN